MFALEGPLDHWQAVADTIHADICRRGIDPEIGAFVQSRRSPRSAEETRQPMPTES